MICLHLPGPLKKLPEMTPNGTRIIFVLLIQTLPTFWMTRILILMFIILFFGRVLDSKFMDFQVARIPTWIAKFMAAIQLVLDAQHIESPLLPGESFRSIKGSGMGLGNSSNLANVMKLHDFGSSWGPNPFHRLSPPLISPCGLHFQ